MEVIRYILGFALIGALAIAPAHVLAVGFFLFVIYSIFSLYRDSAESDRKSAAANDKRIQAAKLAKSAKSVSKRVKINVSLESFFDKLESEHRTTNQFMSAESKLEYLSSPQWFNLKQSRLSVADNVCEHCGSSMSLECHHITYENLGDENINDLAILCFDCHTELHEKASVVYSLDGYSGYSRQNQYPLSFLD